MKLTKSDIENLGNLSRLSLTDKEKEILGQECSAILDYVSELSAVSVGVVKDAVDEKNVCRDDIVTVEGGVYTERFLSLAPRSKNGFIEVPKVFNEEN